MSPLDKESGGESSDAPLAELDEAITQAEVDGDEGILKLLRPVRAENAKRRVANRELSDRLGQIEADVAAYADRLASADKALAESQAEIKRLQEERAAWLKQTEDHNQAVIDSLPERLHPLIPSGLDAASLRGWLDTAVPLLRMAPAPLEAEAGSTGSRTRAVPVTEDVAAVAKALHIDPQLLAEREQMRAKDGNKRI